MTNHLAGLGVLWLRAVTMTVTAGPYFGVKPPGNTVVMENNIPAGFRQENIDAKYELLARGTYSSTQTHIENAIFGIDPKTPRALFEARNAVRIAHNAAADKYASSIMAKADQQLTSAEPADPQTQGRRAINPP